MVLVVMPIMASATNMFFSLQFGDLSRGNAMLEAFSMEQGSNHSTSNAANNNRHDGTAHSSSLCH